MLIMGGPPSLFPLREGGGTHMEQKEGRLEHNNLGKFEVFFCSTTETVGINGLGKISESEALDGVMRSRPLVWGWFWGWFWVCSGVRVRVGKESLGRSQV